MFLLNCIVLGILLLICNTNVNGNDENNVVNGICYEIEDKIVGIAHYRTMPRPIKGQYIGLIGMLLLFSIHLV